MAPGEYLMEDLIKKITRNPNVNSGIRTKGQIVDAQYEISLNKTVFTGVDSDSAVSGVDGLLVRPAITKSQWLNCQ